jgi:hypothetical protein
VRHRKASESNHPTKRIADTNKELGFVAFCSQVCEIAAMLQKLLVKVWSTGRLVHDATHIKISPRRGVKQNSPFP